MISKELISTTADLLRQSQRPLFVWGAGMRPYREMSLALARSLGVPVACTWGAIDLINHDDPLNAGAFGTHGTRAANFAVQNADLLVSLGARLDTKATGTPSDFSRAAKIVMVDIDQAEISKFDKLGRKIDVGICADAGEFIDSFSNIWAWPTGVLGVGCGIDWHNWRGRVQQWKLKYRPSGAPYDLMRNISEYTTPDDIIVSDTGNTLGWIMQGFPFKGERFIHAFNFTPMGYGLAGAVGASFGAGPARRVVCIVGDGGALMSINELATIARHKLNIKIILLNNEGHAMCRHTQRQWLGGNYPATSIEGGLGFPWWRPVADAFKIRTFGRTEWEQFWQWTGGPSFFEAHIDPDASLATQSRYGAPIEDSEPALSREELRREMIIPIMETPMFGVTSAQINTIIKNKQWRHL